MGRNGSGRPLNCCDGTRRFGQNNEPYDGTMVLCDSGLGSNEQLVVLQVTLVHL